MKIVVYRAFIHKSIPEYFYASYVKSKSENAKEKIYSKMISNYDFFHQTINVRYFLEGIDLYSYKKFFQVAIINRYIDYYEISESDNRIFEEFYCNEIIDVLMINGETLSHIDCAPFEIKMFIKFSLEDVMSSNFTFGVGKKEDFLKELDYLEKLHPVQTFLNSEQIKQVKDKSIEVGKKLLLEREALELSLQQFDDIDLDF